MKFGGKAQKEGVPVAALLSFNEAADEVRRKDRGFAALAKIMGGLQ